MTEGGPSLVSGCCPPVRAATGDGGGSATGRPAVSGAPVDTVDIPGGKAKVGTDRPLLQVDGEGPLRTKRVKPFRMDACAVTNARFQEFVEATGYVTEAERLGDSFVFVNFLPADSPPSRSLPAAPWWRMVEGASWRLVHGPGSEDEWRPDHPVVQVSWNDACAFAAWAGGRLPTEAQWEHAARGGLGDVQYPWGDREPDDEAYFPCNIWQGRFPDADLGLDGYAGTAPARSYEPNGYGLYCMAGNVWEWTSQPFVVRSRSRAAAVAHRGKEGFKLAKGGSFLCHTSYCHRYRIAARTGSSPDSSTSHQGFRVVYDPSTARPC